MDLFNYEHRQRLSPIIKWAGGKEKELPIIFSYAPQGCANYYEPFVGGGSVFTAFSASRYFINDKSEELISLYRSIASSDTAFFRWLNLFDRVWVSMLQFVDRHRDLIQSYLLYRASALSDAAMLEVISRFLVSNRHELEEVLDVAFSWHRDSYHAELEKNLIRKFRRMKQLEQKKHDLPVSDVFDNIETAFMSGLYMYFRRLYNDKDLMTENIPLSTAVFVFIRNYAYSGMFRYSSKGEFNVPYGGIGYNHKQLRKKIDYYSTEDLRSHLAKTLISNLDFEDFLEKYAPNEDDFIFLDPPYDSEFSTYAQNTFSQDDQRRLADYLIHKCKGKWMMIIKNTPFIMSLYENAGLTIKSFDKKYLVSFMNRNDKKAEHLVIMNY